MYSICSTSTRKNMLCNNRVVSSSSWTKGSKAEGGERKNWGEERGAGMQSYSSSNAVQGSVGVQSSHVKRGVGPATHGMTPVQ